MSLAVAQIASLRFGVCLLCSTTQVEGAGTQRCNGIYRVSAEDTSSAHQRTPRLRRSLGAPTYYSQSEEGGFVRMTQYKMLSTKAFWWFIRCASLSSTAANNVSDSGGGARDVFFSTPMYLFFLAKGRWLRRRSARR